MSAFHFKTSLPTRRLEMGEKFDKARAAMLAAPAAVAGSDGTRQTMRVAGLVQRFGLEDDDAWSLLCEYSARCEPPWDTEATTGANSLRRLFDSAAQRDGKSAGARASLPSLPRSAAARPVLPTVDALKVAERFAAGVVATGQNWIEASAETADRTDWRVVAKLFKPDECLSVVTEAVQAGEKWKPSGAGNVFTADYVTTKEQRLVLRGFTEAAGAWCRINPMKPGSRGASDADVASFRHVLLESDTLPIGLQIKVLWRLHELGLPVALLVHSGGGSVHAWVRVDCADADSYKATVARLFALPLGFDPKNKNPSRLSRWPNVKRGSGLQSCIFIDPNVNALDESTLARIESIVASEGCAVSPVVDALAIESVPDASAGAAAGFGSFGSAKAGDNPPVIAAKEYPEPQAIAATLTPVLAFNSAWLPASLRPWIADIAERMQCPPDFPAVAAMTALSSIAGRRFCIQPKEQDEAYIEFPHLWGMLIGRPSLMKSPSMQAAMRPLRAMEHEAFTKHEGNERERRAGEIAAKFKRKGLESKAMKATNSGEAFDYAALIETEGEESPLRRFVINDASIEKLGEVLRENPTGTLLYQDELAGLLALLEKDGNQALRTFLLQAWAGKEGFTFDRIGRGTRRIEHCALSVLGSIQPGVLAAHVRAANSNGEGADGFLQRFSLMVWPDLSKEWRDVDRPLDRLAEDEATSVFQTIEALTPEQLIQSGAREGRDGVPTFHFAPEAQERFREWRYAFETGLRSESMAPAFEGHLGKYRKLVPALAVLIHVAEWQTGAVRLSALERALSWADYLESHAARIYSAGTVAECDAARALLRRLQDGSAGLPAEFTARLIRRKGWSGLDTTDKVEAACEVLVDHGWLIATQQASTEKGGRPTYLYRLNPRAENLKGQ